MHTLEHLSFFPSFTRIFDTCEKCVNWTQFVLASDRWPSVRTNFLHVFCSLNHWHLLSPNECSEIVRWHTFTFTIARWFVCACVVVFRLRVSQCRRQRSKVHRKNVSRRKCTGKCYTNKHPYHRAPIKTVIILLMWLIHHLITLSHHAVATVILKFDIHLVNVWFFDVVCMSFRGIGLPT